jgi:anti-sigma B factor antagonist
MSRYGTEGCPEPLHTALERREDTTVVVASGEIDLTSADRLQAQLRDLLNGSRRLVLDLREVVFVDSTALHCMLVIDEASRAAGVEFALVRGPRQVQRLFDLTRTEERLHFVEPLEPLGEGAG